MRISFIFVGLAAIAMLGCANGNGSESKAPEKGSGKKGGKGGDNVPVLVAKVATKDVPVEIQVIGNVEAYSTISVRSQITGQLQSVHFHEGDFVKKGDELFVIDPSPFQATLSQSEANVARDSAIIEQLRANLNRDMAQQKFVTGQANRFASLSREGVISKDQAEQVQSNADALAQTVNADQAAIRSAEASVQAGNAAVRNARIMVGYTSIKAQVDGQTGVISAKEGNLITSNNTELTTINQLQPIYVTFSIPESQLAVLKQHMSLGKMEVTANPPDDPSRPESGLLTFVDNRVDATTGTIKLKGTFTNPNRRLTPGQFVRVTLRLATQQNALIVPNQAVQTGQDGLFVYRVKDDMSVETAKVVTGSRVDQDVVVQDGLNEGDTVVTEGQLRLAPGMHVRLRDNAGGGGRGGRGGKGKKS